MPSELTRAQLQAEADTYVQDNNAKEIDAQDVRDRLKNHAESALIKLNDSTSFTRGLLLTSHAEAARATLLCNEAMPGYAPSPVPGDVYPVCGYLNVPVTILSLYAKCASGSATVAVKIGGVAVTGLSAVSVTTSSGTPTSATAANEGAITNRITVEVVAASSCIGLEFVVICVARTPNGPGGAFGPTTLFGSGTPGAGLGSNGDWYIDISAGATNGDVYYKSSGAWVLKTNAKGPGYAATSATSLATGTGSKALTTQLHLAYSVGARVRLYSTGSGDWMEGIVAAYTSSTGAMTVTVDRANGSGTRTDWTINIAGEISGSALGSDFHFSASGKFYLKNQTDGMYHRLTVETVDGVASLVLDTTGTGSPT